jgi:hypothetical protein
MASGKDGKRQGSNTVVARPSEKDLRYIRWIDAMGWQDLRMLWDTIKGGNTPGWDQGKALEHLVIRAFKLGGVDAEYPYHVPPGGRILEQIDGVVFHFTEPALIIADLSVPHRILLWSELDIGESLRNESFAATLRSKYRSLCMYGLTDHSPYYQKFEVT